MDTLETLGSTEYAMSRVMIRIDSISSAKTAAETLYRFTALPPPLATSPQLLI